MSTADGHLRMGLLAPPAADRDPRRTAVTERLDGFGPLGAGLVTALGGYLALLATTIGCGLLLTRVLLHVESIRHADNSAIRWMVERRTPFETDLSWIGSHLAETGTIIGGVIAVSVLLMFRRRMLAALFLVTSIAIEGAIYMGTVLVVHRARPQVKRLDDLQSLSFPSGHTAASVVMYGGIAFIVWSATRNRAARAISLGAAIVAPLAVGLARMYRGMHHPTDVLGGFVIGIGCLWVGWTVTRVVATAFERRRTQVSS